MDFLNDYLVLIVIGICLCVGYVIKNLIPGDKINKFIPLIMAVLGVGLNIWLNFAFSPEILLGGLASGLASTGMHQVFKQFIEKKDGEQ
jgi:uncharacterized oligopeptide transporter (OPT) family protein